MVYLDGVSKDRGSEYMPEVKGNPLANLDQLGKMSFYSIVGVM